jgi:hypothetical protein
MLLARGKILTHYFNDDYDEVEDFSDVAVVTSTFFVHSFKNFSRSGEIDMPASTSASISSAMFADQHRAQRMPSAKHFMCLAAMAAASAATASIRIIETGVTTPVSFVALLSLILTLVLISLILSCLAGLNVTGLVGLVGTTLSQSIPKGD